MAVRIHNTVPWLLPLTTQDMRAALYAMLEVCDEGGAENTPLDLYIVRDGAMAQENARHMGCVGPTNVLSFPPAPGMVSVPGTLLLSADTLSRECLLYGQEPPEHLLRLLAHGLAHVLGHDHGAEMDELSHEFWLAGCAACAVPHEACLG